MIVGRDTTSTATTSVYKLKFYILRTFPGQRTRNIWLTSRMGAFSATLRASTAALGNFVHLGVPLSGSHKSHSLFSRLSGPQQPHICPGMYGQVFQTCIGIMAPMLMMETKAIDWLRGPPRSGILVKTKSTERIRSGHSRCMT